jgi:hypothetical protein
MFSGLIKLNCIPTTYLGPPDMVGHVSSVQYSHIVPYNRFILLKKSTTKKFKKIAIYTHKKIDNNVSKIFL